MRCAVDAGPRVVNARVHSAGHLIATLLWTGITIFMINLPNLVSEEIKNAMRQGQAPQKGDGPPCG